MNDHIMFTSPPNQIKQTIIPRTENTIENNNKDNELDQNLSMPVPSDDEIDDTINDSNGCFKIPALKSSKSGNSSQSHAPLNQDEEDYTIDLSETEPVNGIPKRVLNNILTARQLFIKRWKRHCQLPFIVIAILVCFLTVFMVLFTIFYRFAQNNDDDIVCIRYPFICQNGTIINATMLISPVV